MASASHLAAAAVASIVALSAAPNGERVITVAQRDGSRAVKAPRTVDISANGRFVAFQSWVRLVAADDDNLPDVYVLDRLTGRVTLESGGTDPGNENSHPRISGDGRFVVFESRSTLSEQLSRIDVVLRDRDASETRLLTAGTQRGNVYAWSRAPDISEDGRRVAFSSAATTLAGPDFNGVLEDVYVVDLATGTTTRASVNNAGLQLSSGTSVLPSLNTDGTIVAFASTAPLDAVDGSAAATPTRQVYVRDLKAGTTTRISRALRGARPDGDSSTPSISGDGRYVAYVSDAANIVAGDDNRGGDVFVFDRETSTTTLVSRGVSGATPDGASGHAIISDDGRYVAFQSDAGNLTCAAHCPAGFEDINLLSDVFVWDRTSGVIVRGSDDELGGWMEWSAGPAIDRLGQVIAFSSRHPMDSSDRGEDLDLFVRSLSPSTSLSTAKK